MFPIYDTQECIENVFKFDRQLIKELYWYETNKNQKRENFHMCENLSCRELNNRISSGIKIEVNAF